VRRSLGLILSLALLATPQLGAGPAFGDPVLHVDPSARFSLRHPRGWQVHEDLSEGWVAFYRDHSREGTSFLVFSRTALPGDLDPDRAPRVTLISVAGLGRYRNLRFRHRSTSHGPGIFSLRGEAGWKSQDGRNVRAVFVAVVARPPVHGGDTQLSYLLLAQAPEEDWPRQEPLLLEMLRDFKWLGG
jgi:hypothetical protein